jgi:hypothetical protein
MRRIFNPVEIVKKLIPYDTAIHFIVGNLAFIPILLLLKVLHFTPFSIVMTALAIITSAAVIGHVQSPKRRYGAEDIVYTLLGALSAIVTYIIGVMTV